MEGKTAPDVSVSVCVSWQMNRFKREFEYVKLHRYRFTGPFEYIYAI